MRTLVASVVAAAGAVLGLLLGRRETERRAVANRKITVVELPSMADVLEEAEGLWRGPAPDEAGYRELAAAGATLVVDLRAEDDGGDAGRWATAAGLDRLVLPTLNGRTPPVDHVDAFAAAHYRTSGATYVHCEAGEGRTGAILGAYAVRSGRARSPVIADALSVGSLTFAQLVYIATGARFPVVVTLVDRMIDRPTEAAFDVLRRAQAN